MFITVISLVSVSGWRCVRYSHFPGVCVRMAMCSLQSFPWCLCQDGDVFMTVISLVSVSGWRCVHDSHFPSVCVRMAMCSLQSFPWCLCQDGDVFIIIIIIIIITIIIIIIIAFKGAIRDFLHSPHSAANCLQHVRSSGPGAIVRKSRATHLALFTCKCHVTCHSVRRDSSAVKFDRVEIAFI